MRFHWRMLPADEIAVDDGLPVTCAVRVLFDLAGTLPEWQFRRALKELHVRGLYGKLSLVDLLDRHPGPPGAALLRRVVEERSGPTTSVPTDGEERFIALVNGAELPNPSHRFGIALGGEWVEVDFAWPHLRVAVEVDSRFHEVQDGREIDHERDQALMAAGWWVFRVTWRQLRFEPQKVLTRLLQLLARAEAERSLRRRHWTRSS